MHIDTKQSSNWDLIAVTNEQKIKENKKINTNFLESLTAEVKANPAVGKGLASKVIKCIDTSQIDTKVLKDFLCNLTDKQTLRGKFCTELKDKTPFVMELFNKFQESDENLIITLLTSIPHLSDVELNQILKKAIETEKKTVVEELLKREFPIDTPLFHLACEKGMKAVVIHMLEKDKGLLEVRNDAYMTPLLIAIDRKQEAVALALIKAGADIGAVDIEMQAVIHVACKMGMLNVVAKILKIDKAQIDTKDLNGFTPFMYTLNYKQESTALMLIKQGANINKQASGFAPIHVACSSNMEKVISKILEKDKDQLNAKDSNGRTLLMHAVRSKNKPLINKLINLGADLKAQDNNKYTVLHHACRKDMEEIISRLVEKDRSLLDAQTDWEYTPLHQAIFEKKEKIALHLIKLGANIHQATYKEQLPIHLACKNDLTELVSYLLEMDENLLNITDEDGNTPLMQAISFINNDKTAEKLIEWGANLKATDKQGCTALHLACNSKKNSLALKMLEKDPELLYAQAMVRSQLTNPINIALDGRQTSFALEMLCIGLAELTSIQPLLKEARDYDEAEFIIHSNLDKILDPAQNAPGANPLKAAILLADPDLFDIMKDKLKDRYFIHIDNFNIDSAFIEFMALIVEPKHFAKGSQITEVPAMPDFELDKLKDFFDAINFTDPQAPGYKNLLRLGNEEFPINREGLRNGLNGLIQRIKDREPYLGTPRPDTPELIAYYEKFESLLKNLGQIIEKIDDPAERATHLIDIAIMGLHCGGKIGEAASMYHVLSGQMAEGFEAQVCDALRNYRLGIIEDWSRARNEDEISSEVHYYNHYMYLLGKTLHLPEADTFTEPDTFVNITLTPEEALSQFNDFYYPSVLLDFTQNFILDSLKIKSTREACVDWIRDHVPADWQREKYTRILNKIRALEEKGFSRQEIRCRIQREEGFFFTQGDQDPIEAIKLHRQRDYNNHAPKVEEWRKDFYSPIFAEIERMGETANFTEYLTSKKITKKSITSKADAKAAVIERRRKNFFFHKPEESSWKEEFYGDLFKTVEGMQSRDDIRRTLQEKGIELEPDRDFENLLEQVRGLEYLSTVFKYGKEGKIVGIDRVAVRNILKQMEVLANF